MKTAAVIPQISELELPDSRVPELGDLMEKTGLATRKDLINNALGLFECAVRERRAGRTMSVQRNARN